MKGNRTSINLRLKEAVLDSPLTDAVSRNPKEASVRLGTGAMIDNSWITAPVPVPWLS
jgi:hypothetical protein